jgi:hypothetical protein
MRAKFKNDDDDVVTEILRRAINKSESTGDDLQRRLSAAAEELGISEEALRLAETEYRMEKSRSEKLAKYRQESVGAFRFHLMIYCIVNFALVGINLLTYRDDHEIWFPYGFLGWGIGIMIHAAVTFRRVDWDSEEFQRWLAKRDVADADQTRQPRRRH